MKRYSCDCDIGSVLIGDGNWTFAVPNIGGDGVTEVLIFDSGDEFAESLEGKEMKFISSVQGKINVYDYDCVYPELMRGESVAPMATLDGRYGVYHGYYKVAFVKWRM